MFLSRSATLAKSRYYSQYSLSNLISSAASAKKTKPPNAATLKPIAQKPHSIPRTVQSQNNSKAKSSKYQSAKKEETPPNLVPIPPNIRAKDLSRLLSVNLPELSAVAHKALGIKIDGQDHQLDQDIASLIAMEFNFLPESISSNPIPTSPSSGSSFQKAFVSRRPAPSEEERQNWPSRAPVVTIMGHIDHGKTTLLDALRKSSVAATEAGGITQHIGAFSVLLPSNKRITFLDTPGHALFTSMRARGAKVTDLVILVVAADDGIMPQTIEAINHAKAAKVPIIVAVNKCDKPAANIDKVLYQLMEHGIEPEKFGGDVQCVPVSALKGTGLDELEESVIVQSEMMDLRGDPTGMCEATVIESKMIKGKGPVASILIERGSLSQGDVLVFGNGKTYCKVRAIVDENGNQIKSAYPSIPCEISGSWSSMPEAGDEGVQVKTENLARQIIQDFETEVKTRKSLHDLAMSGQRRMLAKGTLEMKKRLYESKRNRLQHIKHMRDLYGKYLRALDSLQKEIVELQQIEDANEIKSSVVAKQLQVVIKADVHGSLEAVKQALDSISSKINQCSDSESKLMEHVDVKVLHSSVGPVTQSDIDLLAASKRNDDIRCALIGFNVPRPKKQIDSMLKSNKIPFISHNIIYNLLDEVKELAGGMLSPRFRYETIGEAEVLAIFNISGGKEVIAGCRVHEGSLFRNKNAAVQAKNSQVASDHDVLYRVYRGNEIVYSGALKTLKHHKNEVASITKGMECGLSFGDQFKNVLVGDRIVCVEEIPVFPDLSN